MSRSRKALVAACVVAALVVVPERVGDERPQFQAAVRATRTPSQFVRDVPTWRIVKHQAALQRIARRNGDTREVLSNGLHRVGSHYVVKTLKQRGLQARRRSQFNFPFWTGVGPGRPEPRLCRRRRPTGTATRSRQRQS